MIRGLQGIKVIYFLSMKEDKDFELNTKNNRIFALCVLRMFLFLCPVPFQVQF